MSTKIKKLFSLLLVIVLLFSNSQVAQALSDESILLRLEYPVLYPNDGLSYPDLMNSAGPNVEALEKTVNIDTFRDALIKGFASCPSTLDISAFKIPGTTANWNALKSYIWYETPELFHVKGLGYATKGGYISYIAASYHYTAEQYSTMYQDFLNGANKLLSGIKDNDNLDDVEKALLLHDRIAIWCEYTQGAIPQESFNAYGVFVKQNAVCMGYAFAYDYLLRQVGIDSYYCSSELLNHAWNIVIIDGNKYHVDVTWDDPTYDRSGYVRHINFLRSTVGMKETNHTATDYDSTPTDTTYDSYYWQNSTTAFQLVDEDIYYIDNTAQTLNKINNGVITTCKSVSNKWKAGAYSSWVGNFTVLSYDGKNLLYSQPQSIYKYDTETGAAEIVFSPDLSGGSYYSIYGFKFEDCKLICEVLDSPNYDANTKKNYTQTQTHHVESDWIIIKAPSPDSSGIKQKSCINCNKAFEESTIPAISVTAKEHTTIDYTNSLIFTDVFTCQNINNLVSTSDNTTVSIESSNAFYGTGTVVALSVNGEAVHKLTIIVNGDINGDSVCDVIDLVLAARYSTNTQTPSQNEIYAANCGIAGTIDETTYQNLVNKALSI